MASPGRSQTPEGSPPSSNPSSPQRSAQEPSSRHRSSTGASTRLRAASIKQILESHPPLGMWQATGEAASKAPSLAEIRRGSFGHNGWSEDGQRAEYSRRNSAASEQGSMRRRFSRTNSGQSAGIVRSLSQQSPVMVTEAVDEDGTGPSAVLRNDLHDPQTNTSPTPPIVSGSDIPTQDIPATTIGARESSSSNPVEPKPIVPDENGFYPNGYHPPPKKSWREATVIGLKGFWRFFLTPLGFFVVIYGLNVVAWGGMLFLLLCNAAPAMCHPTCNDINSPRRIWIEIDSQILNALFCVTGFGLIPWRFRDFWYLLQFRVLKKASGLRRLAGIHRGWFRLAGSDALHALRRDGRDPDAAPPSSSADDDDAAKDNPALPIPPSAAPDPPLTGVRAPPTAVWKLDFVIWAYVLNTFLQAVLSGFMWGYNRYRRPSWSTGFFVALACIVAGAGGLMVYLEGKKVKKIEGIPVKEDEVLADVERGVEEKRKLKLKQKQKEKEKVVEAGETGNGVVGGGGLSS